MYPDHVRAEALDALSAGASLSAASRNCGVSRSTLRAWRDGPRAERSTCPRCELDSFDEQAYSALFGYYLGDGCISRHARYHALRISCDAKYPVIIADVEHVIEDVRPEHRTFRVPGPGVIVVQSNWVHWPCMLPQHGPGRKHERLLGIESWQWDIVQKHPADFLRGLFHSDGCRVRNWAMQLVGGEKKRYEYPRWQFVNESAEIMTWCRDALDLAEIPWRQTNRRTLSVSRRDAVARLDALIGPKC